MTWCTSRTAAPFRGTPLLKILQYRGRSVISRAIRVQTRSIYSHSAILLTDTLEVFEAWAVGGVLRSRNYLAVHTPGTPVDVFRITGDYDEDRVRAFCGLQLGKKYDFGAVARFMTRRKARDNNKWFCSELVAAAFAVGGLDLLNERVAHSYLAPRDIALSPLLDFEKTIKGDEGIL